MSEQDSKAFASLKNQIQMDKKLEYNKIFDIVKFWRLETYVICGFIFQTLAVTQNLLILPAKLLFSIYTSIKQKDTSDLASIYVMSIRVLTIVLSAWILTYITNPSMIYHTLRGQGIFKLYMIKAVNEIFDLLLKGYGKGVLDNFARAVIQFRTQFQKKQNFFQSLNGDLIGATVGLFIYSTLHGLILCMEMFTLHVVLTSSPDSILSFLFYNNFGEVKITVFKKCDIAGLYQYANNDVVERF